MFILVELASKTWLAGAGLSDVYTELSPDAFGMLHAGLPMVSLVGFRAPTSTQPMRKSVNLATDAQRGRNQ